MSNIYKYYIFFQLTLICGAGFSQKNLTDSLSLVLKNTTEDTTKLRILIELSEECPPNDIIKYANPAIELADKILKESQGFSLQQKNKILVQKGVALNNMGFIFNNQGLIKKGLEYYQKSLQLREAIGDKNGIAQSLDNIGSVYDSQGDIQSALKFYKQAFKLREETGDKLDISMSLSTIGSVYHQQKSYAMALSYLEKGLKLQEEMGDKEGFAFTLTNIGIVHKDKGDIALALTYLQRALVIQKEIDDKEGIAYSLEGIGLVYKTLKNYPKALAYLDSSLAIAKELGFPEGIRNSEETISEINSAIGNYAGAFEHYKQYIFYRDSISNENNRKATITNQLKYEFEKKEAVIKEQQEKERILADEKSRFQQIAIWSAIIGLIMVLVFAGFIVRTLKATRFQKLVIEEKQREILDSIHYAKRIQKSLLPTEKYIDKSLYRLKQ